MGQFVVEPPGKVSFFHKLVQLDYDLISDLLLFHPQIGFCENHPQGCIEQLSASLLKDILQDQRTEHLKQAKIKFF